MKKRISKLKGKYLKTEKVERLKKKLKNRVWSPDFASLNIKSQSPWIIKENKKVSPIPQRTQIQSKLNKIRNKFNDEKASKYNQKTLHKYSNNSMTVDERSNKIRDEINSVEEMLSYEQNFKNSLHYHFNITSKQNQVKNLMTRLLSP